MKDDGVVFMQPQALKDRRQDGEGHGQGKAAKGLLPLPELFGDQM